MKTYNNLFANVYSFDALRQAHSRAKRGKADSNEAMAFEHNLEENIIQLQNELVWSEYQTGPYHRFYVHEPKIRLVAALPYRDRVVQHSLVAAIENIWEKRFIHHSYACRPGKGLHAGADQAQQWLRDVQREHGRAYVLKADILKYFPSINHDVLIRQLARRIRCKPTLTLLTDILQTWADGLPIGSLTSQLEANINLHDLDMHAKQNLREHRYMRYMDDWLIIHHNKDHLHRLRRHLSQWLWHHLRLKLNNKTQVFPVAETNGRGLDFLGYRIWPTHRRLREDSVKRMVKRIKHMQRAYAAGRVGREHVYQRIQSWLAHASYADSYRIRQKLMGEATFQRGSAT